MILGRNSVVDRDRKGEIASSLYEVGGVKFGEFTLTSGKTSPYYVDLRIVPSYPELFDMVTEFCADLVEREIGNDYKIAGVPTGGLPYATLVSYKLGLPLLYVRKKKKSHGREKGVEGEFEEGEVVLIDDVTTTGGSIKEAAETVREEKGKVNHAVVILDREEEAEKELETAGVSLHSCFKISELVKHLKENGKITDGEYSTILDYLKK